MTNKAPKSIAPKLWNKITAVHGVLYVNLRFQRTVRFARTSDGTSSVSFKDLLTRAASYRVSTVDLYSRRYSLNTDQIEYRRNYLLNTDYYLIIHVIKLSVTFRHFVFPCVCLLVGLLYIMLAFFQAFYWRKSIERKIICFFYENKKETNFLNRERRLKLQILKNFKQYSWVENEDKP